MMTEQQKKDKADWGEWLRGVIMDRLSGTGLRPEVEWVEPLTEEDRKNPGQMKQVRASYYRLTIVCPLEWKVTNKLFGDEGIREKAEEITDAVLYFYREAWPDRICCDYQYDIWKRVPGFFDWTTEQAPEILYRVTMQQLTQRFGARNIRGITLYEDLLIVHTRRGDYRIDIDNYRDRLEEVAGYMGGVMRRPIRYQFLQKLRQQKRQDNHTDGNEPEK